MDPRADRQIEIDMQNIEPVLPERNPRPRHWLFFMAGGLLFLLGPAMYFVQFRWKYLDTPWYVPLTATAGLALMFVSVWRRRGVVRILGMVFFTLACGFEWYMLVVGTATPHYSGPAQPGRALPEFAAYLADGTPFTNTDLAQGTPTVLLFFRGRW